MKIALSAVSVLLLFAACQKDGSVKDELESFSVSSDALLPKPCHSTEFVTGYPVRPGQVPPFRFSKTLWSDNRVKTINMLSRANPIHAGFKPQAWELTGRFTYSKNAATFTGTKELWEYYKTSTGAAGKKSVLKKDVSLSFSFYNAEQGTEEAMEAGTCYLVYNNLENEEALRTYLYPSIVVGPGSDEPQIRYAVNYSEGSQLTIYPDEVSQGPVERKHQKKITYTYRPGVYLESKKNLSYQPTQNWVSLEYTLLEVMQWLPSMYRPDIERAGVSVEFYYPHNENTYYKAVQTRQYKNYEYDSIGNLLSFTYEDNVAQQTTWICR